MPKAKLSKDTKPSFSYLIEKKRDGGEFTTEEIRFIVDSILDEEMPEFQQAAWVMATFFQGMSAQETAFFAEEMMLSGEVIEMMDVSRPKIEKYSTGGVGTRLPRIGSSVGCRRGGDALDERRRRRVSYLEQRKIIGYSEHQHFHRFGGLLGSSQENRLLLCGFA